MKKTYTTPTIKVIDIDSTEVICTSIQARIGYGGEVTGTDGFDVTGEGEIVAGAGGYRSTLWN